MAREMAARAAAPAAAAAQGQRASPAASAFARARSWTTATWASRTSPCRTQRRRWTPRRARMGGGMDIYLWKNMHVKKRVCKLYVYCNYM